MTGASLEIEDLQQHSKNKLLMTLEADRLGHSAHDSIEPMKACIARN